MPNTQSLPSFERGEKDTFDVPGVDVGDITHILVGHDNKGMGAAWHLQQVRRRNSLGAGTGGEDMA